MPTSFDFNLLPEKAPDEVRDFIFKQEELPHEMPFRRVSVPTEIGLDFDINTPYDEEIFNKKSKKRTWAAECICPHCTDRLYFKWGSGKNWPYMWVRLDEGCGVDEDLTAPTSKLVKIKSGEGIICPHCGGASILMHTSKYSSGIYRTGLHEYQCCVQSVELIDGKYTALVSWLASRACDKHGNTSDSVRPVEAIVVLEGGKLQRYIHEVKSGFAGRAEIPLPNWKKVKGTRDYLQVKYNTYYAWGGMAVGGYVLANAAAVGKGTTGEKTGLLEYIRAGGGNPALYLIEWKKHKNLENLIKSSARRFVVEKNKPAATVSRELTAEELNELTLSAVRDEAAAQEKAKKRELAALKKEHESEKKGLEKKAQDLEKQLKESKKQLAEFNVLKEIHVATEAKVDELEKQAKLAANPEVLRFGFYFEEAQKNIAEMKKIINGADEETAAKFRRALQAVAQTLSGEN